MIGFLDCLGLREIRKFELDIEVVGIIPSGIGVGIGSEILEVDQWESWMIVLA